MSTIVLQNSANRVGNRDLYIPCSQGRTLTRFRALICWLCSPIIHILKMASSPTETQLLPSQILGAELHLRRPEPRPIPVDNTFSQLAPSIVGFPFNSSKRQVHRHASYLAFSKENIQLLALSSCVIDLPWHPFELKHSSFDSVLFWEEVKHTTKQIQDRMQARIIILIRFNNSITASGR